MNILLMGLHFSERKCQQLLMCLVPSSFMNKEKVSICTKLLASNKKDDDRDKSDVAELSKEGGILLKDFLINKLLGFLCLAGR